MKKGEIKHTVRSKSEKKMPLQSIDQWVGLKTSNLSKLTVEIPEDLYKKLRLEAANRSSKEKKVYIRDILMEALDKYFEK